MFAFPYQLDVKCRHLWHGLWQATLESTRWESRLLPWSTTSMMRASWSVLTTTSVSCSWNRLWGTFLATRTPELLETDKEGVKPVKSVSRPSYLHTCLNGPDIVTTSARKGLRSSEADGCLIWVNEVNSFLFQELSTFAICRQGIIRYVNVPRYVHLRAGACKVVALLPNLMLAVSSERSHLARDSSPEMGPSPVRLCSIGDSDWRAVCSQHSASSI